MSLDYYQCKIRNFQRAANLVCIAEAQTWNINWRMGFMSELYISIRGLLELIVSRHFHFLFEQISPKRDEGACSFLYMLLLRTNFGSSFSSCFCRNWIFLHLRWMKLALTCGVYCSFPTAIANAQSGQDSNEPDSLLQSLVRLWRPKPRRAGIQGKLFR